MEKQYYISIKGCLHPVSEQVWQIHSRSIGNERYRARRDNRCSNPRFQECSGDCGLCKWQVQGSNLSLDNLLDTGHENSDRDRFRHELADTAPQVEDIVCDRLLLESLYLKLDELMPDGGQIFRWIADGYSEREIASMLGVRQSTFNYRKQKLYTYIRENFANILD